MRARLHQRLRDERGVVLVAGLLLALSLLLVIGAAVEIDRAFIDRREFVSVATVPRSPEARRSAWRRSVPGGINQGSAPGRP